MSDNLQSNIANPENQSTPEQGVDENGQQNTDKSSGVLSSQIEKLTEVKNQGQGGKKDDEDDENGNKTKDNESHRQKLPEESVEERANRLEKEMIRMRLHVMAMMGSSTPPAQIESQRNKVIERLHKEYQKKQGHTVKE